MTKSPRSRRPPRGAPVPVEEVVSLDGALPLPAVDHLDGADALTSLYDEARQTIAGWCRDAERSTSELLASAEERRRDAEHQAEVVLAQASAEAEAVLSSARAEAEDLLARARAGPEEPVAGTRPEVGPNEGSVRLGDAMQHLSESVRAMLVELEQTLAVVGLYCSAATPDRTSRGSSDALRSAVDRLLDAVDQLIGRVDEMEGAIGPAPSP